MTLLNVTRDTKIHVRLRVNPAALQRRLPQPWTIAPAGEGPHAGANLVVIFSEVLLRQDADGGPAPDSVDLSAAFLIPAAHAQTQEPASFIFRVLTANPGAVPGRYRNSVRAAVRRARSLVGHGVSTTITDEIVLESADGGVVELRLQYESGVPVRMRWLTTLRSAADPALARAYSSDALVDVVWSEPAGILRARDVRFRVTEPSLRDLFDGTERLVSITALPWFVREEFEPAAQPEVS